MPAQACPRTHYKITAPLTRLSHLAAAGIEHHEHPTFALFFRRIHRFIRLAQQGLGFNMPARPEEGDADTRLHAQHVPIKLHRPPQGHP